MCTLLKTSSQALESTVMFKTSRNLTFHRASIIVSNSFSSQTRKETCIRTQTSKQHVNVNKEGANMRSNLLSQQNKLKIVTVSTIASPGCIFYVLLLFYSLFVFDSVTFVSVGCIVTSCSASVTSRLTRLCNDWRGCHGFSDPKRSSRKKRSEQRV